MSSRMSRAIDKWLFNRFHNYKWFWQSQVWINTRWLLVCVGRLPMFSAEPWGLWVSIGDHNPPKPIENIDRPRGRFMPKRPAWEGRVLLPRFLQHLPPETPVVIEE